MGKLFGGKERKQQDTDPAASLDSFFHSSADHLQITHPPPPPPPTLIPKLSKLDTSISRYPQAVAVNQQAQQNRPLAPGYHETNKSPSKSPRPNKRVVLYDLPTRTRRLLAKEGTNARRQ